MGLTDSIKGFFEPDIEDRYAKMRIKETPWGEEARGWIQDLLKKDIQYPTQQVAGLSDIEQSGLSILKDIMAGKAFADPRTSPYYAGLREESERLTDQGTAALRHRQNLGGMFRSSPGVRMEGEYHGLMDENLLQELGRLYETERARDNPYTRLQAGMTYGQLPRMIEQQQYNAEMEKKTSDLLAPYSLQSPLANLMLQYAPYQVAGQITSPSWHSIFERFGDPASQWGQSALSNWPGVSGGGYNSGVQSSGSTGSGVVSSGSSSVAPSVGAGSGSASPSISGGAASSTASSADSASNAADLAAKAGAAIKIISSLWSDRRLKSNIQYLSYPWATWVWNKKGNQKGLYGRGFGMIAQDVLKFAPRAVTIDDTGYLMINYGGL